METITYADFERLEIRVGTIVKAEEFPEARRPAYKVWIDFGSFGTRKTSAQITQLYDTANLVGEAGQVVLLQPECSVENGLRIL